LCAFKFSTEFDHGTVITADIQSQHTVTADILQMFKIEDQGDQKSRAQRTMTYKQ